MHERISDMKQRLTVVETDLPYIRESQQRIEASMNRRFDRLDDAVTWAFRIVLGAVLAAGATFVVRGGLFLG